MLKSLAAALTGAACAWSLTRAGSQDFRTDLPENAELRALAARTLARPGLARVAHEPLLWSELDDDAPAEFSAWRDTALDEQRAAGRAQRDVTGWRTVLADGRELYLLELVPKDTVTPEWRITVRTPGQAPCPRGRVFSGAGWCEALRPLPEQVACVDLDLDGAPELAFSQYEHNGTVTNVEHVHYLSLATGRELSTLLELSRREWISVRSHGEEGWVRRALARDERGALRVLVWAENPAFGQVPAALGELLLEANAAREFSVSQRAVHLGPFADHVGL